MKEFFESLRDLWFKILKERKIPAGKINLLGGIVLIGLIALLTVSTVSFNFINGILLFCEKKPLPTIESYWIVALIALWVGYMLYSIRITLHK